MRRLGLTCVLAFSLVCVHVAAGEQAGRTIRGGGRLQPAESHTIRSQVPRPTAVLYVAPEGQVVEKGDLLIELDSSTWAEEGAELRAQTFEAGARWRAAKAALPTVKKETEAAVELAEQGLHVAKLGQEMYVTGEYPAQVAEAEAAVNLARERFAQANERLAELKVAEGSGRTAPGRLSEAKLAQREAESRLKAAENRLHLIKDVMHAYRRASLQLAIMEREFALMRAQNEAKRAVREAEIALEVARARAIAQERRAELFEEAIRACKLYAPSAGMVQHVREPWGGSSADVLIERGCVVHSQQPLLRVVDTQRFKLSVPVDLQIAQQVKTGREVSVRVDAVPAQTFKGRIAEMRALPQRPSGAARGLLTIIVENTTAQLRPGMTARVESEL